MSQQAHRASALQEEGKKIIDVETAIQMLSVAMPSCEHLEPFTEFLQEQTEYKTINRDQWMGFLRFTQQVGMGFHAALQASVLWNGRCKSVQPAYVTVLHVVRSSAFKKGSRKSAWASRT